MSKGKVLNYRIYNRDGPIKREELAHLILSGNSEKYSILNIFVEFPLATYDYIHFPTSIDSIYVYLCMNSLKAKEIQHREIITHLRKIDTKVEIK